MKNLVFENAQNNQICQNILGNLDFKTRVKSYSLFIEPKVEFHPLSNKWAKEHGQKTQTVAPCTNELHMHPCHAALL